MRPAGRKNARVGLRGIGDGFRWLGQDALILEDPHLQVAEQKHVALFRRILELDQAMAIEIRQLHDKARAGPFVGSTLQRDHCVLGGFQAIGDLGHARARVDARGDFATREVRKKNVPPRHSLNP